MMEDADEAEMQDDEEDLVSAAKKVEEHRNQKMTPTQTKQLERLDKKKHKMTNLETERKTLRRKRNEQDGLTEGQEARMQQLEERMETLSEEIDQQVFELATSFRAQVQKYSSGGKLIRHTTCSRAKYARKLTKHTHHTHTGEGLGRQRCPLAGNFRSSCQKRQGQSPQQAA